jgi:hypothetical protein
MMAEKWQNVMWWQQSTSMRFFCFGGADHQLREISKTSTNSEQTHFL